MKFPNLKSQISNLKSGTPALLLWTFWWLCNFAANRLIGRTWVPAWSFLGLDFAHNFLAVHLLVHGGNPYLKNFGDARGLYAYPPLVLGLFLWCALFPLSLQFVATILWITVVALLIAYGSRAAWRERQSQGLSPLPFSLILAAILFSTPVLFSMERGNCDALVLALLVLAAHAIKRRRKRDDNLAGVFLGLAMWIKIYPGLIVLALPALKRSRVFLASVATGVLISLLFLPATIQFFKTAQSSEGYRTKFLASAVHLAKDPVKAESGELNSYPPLETFSHSLPIYWQSFWQECGLPTIARVPGMIGTAFLLGPLLLWVFLAVKAAPDAARLSFPYFLWLALAATFWMPVSYDYNLIYLPILAAAVWDRRDGPLVLALLLPLLIYWQPLALKVPMELLLLIKLMALFALAICLVRRARDQISAAYRIS